MDEQITAEDALVAVNDPTTPGATLQTIAAEYPDLWPKIAAHPNAYPDLLNWLSGVGDAQVRAIITTRQTGVPALQQVESDDLWRPQPETPQGEAAWQTSSETIWQMPPEQQPESAWQTQPQAAWQTQPQSQPQPAWQPQPYAQPTSARSGAGNPMIILIVVLVVAILAVGGFITYKLLSNNDQTITPKPSSTSHTTPGTSGTVGAAGTAGTPGSAPSIPIITVTQTQTAAPPPQPVDPETAAMQSLNTQLATDLPRVQSTIEGQWTNMLAAKKDGTLPDGSTWDYEHIWALYQQTKQQYPSALLVQGSAYTSTNLGPEWYTIASGVTFGNPDDALAWCANHNLGGDECYAFIFTNDPSISTVAKHPPQ